MVAIKCLRKASLSASSRDNLISEISALKKLHHPHIVAMHDFRVHGWQGNGIGVIDQDGELYGDSSGCSLGLSLGRS